MSAELVAAMTNYAEAFARNDADEIESLRTPDFVFTSSRGVRVPAAKELADIRSGAARCESAALDQLAVIEHGGTAIITSRVTLKGTWHGEKYDGIFALTTTWIKQGARWRILAEHSSRIE